MPPYTGMLGRKNMREMRIMEEEVGVAHTYASSSYKLSEPLKKAAKPQHKTNSTTVCRTQGHTSPQTHRD